MFWGVYKPFSNTSRSILIKEYHWCDILHSTLAAHRFALFVVILHPHWDEDDRGDYDDDDDWWWWWLMMMMIDDDDAWWWWWLMMMMLDDDDDWWWWWLMMMMSDDWWWCDDLILLGSSCLGRVVQITHWPQLQALASLSVARNEIASCEFGGQQSLQKMSSSTQGTWLNLGDPWWMGWG